jgi:phosphomannomutase
MFCAMQQQRASIMVTGSHIPFDCNGIKFNKSTSEVLKEDEPAILKAVRRVREAEYLRPESDSVFDDFGMFKSRLTSPRVNTQAREAYVERYLNFFPRNALKNLRIVFYQHSAVGRDMLLEIMTSLGAHVIPMGRSSSFAPLDTEAISEDKLRLLQDFADEARQNHGHLDAIVSTDGDSDRPLLAGITSEGKVFFGGDILGILAAEFMNADAVVTPISVSDAVDLWAVSRNVKVRKTRIGSPYVIEGMQIASQGAQPIVGWEANGGFLTGSEIEYYGRRLKALPTRDAALPLLAVLSMACDRNTSIVEMFASLPRRFSKSGLLDDFPAVTSRALMQMFSKSKPSEFEEFFTGDEGFGRVRNINTLDGLRVYFDNGDVAHIRPSGNAPQLRIYAVADSPERAGEILESALREGDGILRKLESAVVRERTEGILVQQIKQNIALTESLFSRGQTPEIIGIGCGTQSAQEFWQSSLDQARSTFSAQAALSFHEDLPTNQAFGLLLLWPRLKPQIQSNFGSLVAFVFGDGTRSTPFTETDCAQKPAMATFVLDRAGESGPRFIPMVELAMKYLVPVQQYLRRSGFKGLVVKWGDEVQVPTLDLSGANELFLDADVVRFVLCARSGPMKQVVALLLLSRGGQLSRWRLLPTVGSFNAATANCLAVLILDPSLCLMPF